MKTKTKRPKTIGFKLRLPLTMTQAAIISSALSNVLVDAVRQGLVVCLVRQDIDSNEEWYSTGHTFTVTQQRLVKAFLCGYVAAMQRPTVWSGWGLTWVEKIYA